MGEEQDQAEDEAPIMTGAGQQPVSVLMSVYNGKRYLGEAIESMLGQHFSDFQFVIVDDGSTDGSSDLVKSYKDRRITLIRQENRGLSAALNAGLTAANGKYIARMDADDISLPDRLKKQYAFLETHPECVGVGCNVMLIDVQGNHLCTSDQPTSWREICSLLPRTPFYHSSTMFRKEAAIQCGGYFEAIKHYFEDLVFFNRLSEFGELRNLPEPLMKFRLVPSAITNQGPAYYNTVLRICRNILRTGTVSQDELELLRKVTRSRTQEWKESNYHLRIGKIYLEQNFNRGKALQNLLLSIQKRPVNGNAWFNLVLSLLPQLVVTRWKNMRYDRWRKG